MSWQDWVLIALALWGAGFGVHKWRVSRDDKRREEDDKELERERKQTNEAQDKVLGEHGARLDRHAQRIAELQNLYTEIREETRKNAVRLERIEGMESRIDSKLEQLHLRVSAIARDLNKTMGRLEAAQEAKLGELVKQITEALEKRNGETS